MKSTGIRSDWRRWDSSSLKGVKATADPASAKQSKDLMVYVFESRACLDKEASILLQEACQIDLENPWVDSLQQARLTEQLPCGMLYSPAD